MRLFCKGRNCGGCGRCRDWYYTGNLADWKWIQNYDNWNKDDRKRWEDGDYWESFHKRADGATCVGDPADLGFIRAHYLDNAGYGTVNALSGLGVASFSDCNAYHYLLPIVCRCDSNRRVLNG